MLSIICALALAIMNIADLPDESTREGQAAIAALARSSPNWFMQIVCDERQGNLQGCMQNHLRDHDDATIIVPRGHGKTKNLEARVAYEIGNDPTIRVKYIQQGAKEAGDTGHDIRDIIDSPEYRKVFPWITPDRNRWSKSAWSVLYEGRRVIKTKDHSFDGRGIFGTAGGRADILVGDDVCDLKNSVRSAVDRERVKDFWNTNWMQMRDISSDKPFRIWKVATPYHVDDLVAEWKQKAEQNGSLMFVPVVDFEPVWDVIDPDELRKIYADIGPTAFARSYELKPASDEDLMFPQAWVDQSMRETIPEWDRKNGRAVLIVDWAFTEAKTTKSEDPDWSVGLICWNAFNGELYVLDCIRMKKDYPTFSRSVISNALENQWLSHFGCANESVQQCWAEGNGPQRGIVQVFRNDAPFPVNSIDRDRDKVTRAAEVQSFVQQGHLHIMGAPGEPLSHLQAVYDELTLFPVAGHDDTVDTVIDAINKVDRKTVRSPNSSRIRSVPRYDGVMM